MSTSEAKQLPSGGTMENGGIDLKAPGVAWDLAIAALSKNPPDIKEAERLLVYMVLSDSRMMLRRILEKEEQMKQPKDPSHR